MKVYILSSPDNIYFAERLLADIPNVKIISRPLPDEKAAEMKNSIEKSIASADTVLIMIDKDFEKNAQLNAELDIALTNVEKNRNHSILSIVIGNAVVPTDLQGLSMPCVKCNSTSEKDLYETKQKIMRALKHRRHSIKKRNLKAQHSKTSSMIFLTLAMEILAILLVILFIKYPFWRFGYFDTESTLFLSIVLIAVVASIVTLLTSYVSIMKRRWQEDEKDEITSYSARLKEAIIPEEIKPIKYSLSENDDKKNEIDALGKRGALAQLEARHDKKNEIDALGRMLINLEDIKEFYTWSQKQAKASFVLAVSMCILGFILMVVAIVLPIAFRLSFQTSIIPAVGGIITELIAGTALVVYRNSLAQLNHYHKALHEDERFLSSVNLLGKFSNEEVQDKMLTEIIRSEIQMNLAGINVNSNVDKSNE